MSSWGEDLLRYKQEKLRTPWDVSRAPTPNPRVKWSDLSQKHRAFNPVLQRDITTPAEQQRQQQEAQQRAQHAARAMENRLATTYIHYDPLTNQTKYPSKVPAPKDPFIIADTRTDYNILNFKNHYNRERWNQFYGSKPADRGKKTEFSDELTYKKDFDILSTKYKKNHYSRVWDEQEQLRQEKEAEFYKRNKFNAVKGIFYDTEKEIAFRKRRKDFIEQHSQKEPQLPPSLLKADGQLFNVVNNEVLDEAGVARKQALDNRSLETRKKKNIFETEVKARQAREYELNLQRKLNRVSHQRDAGVRARGYDPITNEPFAGVGAKKLAPSRQMPSVSPWDKAVHAAARRVIGNQERRSRTQSAGRRALRTGASATSSGRRQPTAQGPVPPGVPFIPRDRKMKSARPRGQTGRVNAR